MNELTQTQREIMDLTERDGLIDPMNQSIGDPITILRRCQELANKGLLYRDGKVYRQKHTQKMTKEDVEKIWGTPISFI